MKLHFDSNQAYQLEAAGKDRGECDVGRGTENINIRNSGFGIWYSGFGI